MGAIFAKSLDENMHKQQQFMLETQRLQLERQLQMQNLLRERMMAMQVAKARDTLTFVGSFTITLTAFASLGFTRNKNPIVFAPLLPLSWVCCYLADMGYGNKMTRIRRDAEDMLVNRPSLFLLPLGSVKVDDIERRRHAELEEDQLKPNNLFL